MNLLKEIRVPQESVNDEYLNIIRLSFKNGDSVKATDIIIELESSKATISLEAGIDGYIQYLCNEGDEVKVGEVIIRVFDTFMQEQLSPTHHINATADSSIPVKQTFVSETVFSPQALELIVKNNIDKDVFKGKDFINTDDVLLLIAPRKDELTDKTKFAPSPQKVDEDLITRKKLSKQKKREIEYLSQVQTAGLNSAINIKVNLEGVLLSIRNNLKYFKDSLLPLIIYETSRLLLKYTELNAFYANEELLYYKSINIGIALDIDDGLKTVNIRNTDTLAINQIEQHLLDLSNKYLDRKLDVRDLSDITFTITDLSAEGAYFFAPLINKNNSAILGISAPDGKEEMILTVTFDHRVTEGKRVTGFLHELKERIESYCNKLVSPTVINQIRCYKCFKKLSDDFSEIGFLKVINKKGEEKYLCQTCLKGL
jgi:pyruvate/2-oxoglutarate dehydrogenase complex dihydrolipoamide acyltransferase (E2) component